MVFRGNQKYSPLGHFYLCFCCCNSRDETDEELEGEPGHVDGLGQHEQGELLALLALLVPGLDMGMKSSNLNI